MAERVEAAPAEIRIAFAQVRAVAEERKVLDT